MRVSDVRREADKHKNTTKRIYNPGIENFTITYDKKSYILPAIDSQEYPSHIADHIADHLADHILHKRGRRGKGAIEVKRAILDEIYISL